MFLQKFGFTCQTFSLQIAQSVLTVLQFLVCVYDNSVCCLSHFYCSYSVEVSWQRGRNWRPRMQRYETCFAYDCLSSVGDLLIAFEQCAKKTPFRACPLDRGNYDVHTCPSGIQRTESLRLTAKSTSLRLAIRHNFLCVLLKGHRLFREQPAQVELVTNHSHWVKPFTAQANLKCEWQGVTSRQEITQQQCVKYS